MSVGKDKEIIDKVRKEKEKKTFDEVDRYNCLMNRHSIKDLKEKIRAILLNLGVHNGKVLEIGSGESYFTDIYAQENTAVCSDINLTLLERNRGTAAMVNCDAEVLPFRDESFDLVMAIFVLHHLPNPGSSLMEARRVLKKGGKIVICEPYKWSLNLIYTNIRILIAKVFGEKFVDGLLICGSAEESYVSMSMVEKALEGFRLSKTKSMPLSLPLTRLTPDSRAFVEINNFLEKIPIIRSFGRFITIVGEKTE